MLTALPSLLGWAPRWQTGGGGQRHLAALPAVQATLTPGVRKQLDRIGERHAALLEQLGGDAMNRLAPAEMARLNKELSDLEPVVEALAELQRKQEEVSCCHTI